MALDIYDFIRSPDIAEYCRKIEHDFSPLEMAVIIDDSEKSFKEKHAAFRHIIDEYPDMPFEVLNDNVETEQWDSLHEFLGQLIESDEKRLEHFFTSDNGYVYQACCMETPEWTFWGRSGYDREPCFSTAEKAWDNLIQNKISSMVKVFAISIHKVPVDADNVKHNGGRIKVNAAGEPYRLYYPAPDDSIIENSLRYVHCYIPIPFEQGDIIQDISGIIGVFHQHLAGATYSSDRGKEYKVDETGKSGWISYYWIDDKGELKCWDRSVKFMSYYKGELKGYNKFLMYLSKYMKRMDGHKCEIDNLINSFLICKAEGDRETYIQLL